MSAAGDAAGAGPSKVPPRKRLDPRSIFDRLTLGLLQTLERRPTVVDVRIQATQPATLADLGAWESRHGQRLPKDLRNFFLCFNGFHLVWLTQHGATQLPVGSLQVNALADLTPLRTSKSSAPPPDVLAALVQLGLAPASSVVGNASSSSPNLEHCFRLATTIDGQAVIIELGHANDLGGIYLQDGDDRCHLLCAGFVAYFRFMTQYMGLPGWQRMRCGLPVSPAWEHWYWQFLPVNQTLRLTRPTHTTSSQTGLSKARPPRSAAPPVTIDMARIINPTRRPTSAGTNSGSAVAATGTSNGHSASTNGGASDATSSGSKKSILKRRGSRSGDGVAPTPPAQRPSNRPRANRSRTTSSSNSSKP
ncbi:uncharacterized protein MONBRDRAFT_7732 [Monosiga brevicollis MX1]|uniref:Knr4/Smi1-like domain-containing protein n=1 Tax=Monosiga brevicollis TaxID=81824 RepID=A9UY51_MONBE|nr:uncharacterized protein MONBRDRAFT_7732 [Monosiga brevicollis MX1]EDQ89800.1 predicted protein [Monosiga brevicollis MX1]|eukprot:XP_001745222.1 hypothetical protein [Monosiga brevicollis MX1]